MKKYLIISFLSLSLFVVMMALVVFVPNMVYRVDETIFYSIENLRNPFLNKIALFFTYLGEEYTIITIIIILLILPNRKKIGCKVAMIGLISAFINNVIKLIVRRKRPMGFFINDTVYSFPTSYSFPSGHAENSLVIYFIFFYLILKLYCKNKKKEKMVMILTTFLIMFIGLSRVFIGVHYFTDVLSGFLLGIATISFYMYFELQNEKSGDKVRDI